MKIASTQTGHVKLPSWIKSPIAIMLFSLPVFLTIGLLTTPYYMLAPLPAIGLAVLLLLCNYPAIAYYAIVFLIPFGAFRTLPGGLKIHWVLAAILLLIVALDAIVHKSLPKKINAQIWPWMIVYLLVSLVSTLGSSYSQTANHTLILLMVALLFLGLTLMMINRHGFVDVLPNVLIWSVSIGSLLAVLGFVFKINFFADKVYDGGFTRSVGASLDPNNMALMIIFIIPLLIYKILHTTKLSARLITICLLLINLGAIVTSYSRGGMLILIFSGLLLLWEFGRRLRPQNIGFGILFLIAGLFLAMIAVPADYWEHQKSLTAGEDFSLQRRASYLVVGWSAVKESPLLGHGPGTFRDIYGDSEIGAAFQKKNKTARRRAHNTYLETFVGTGFLGLCAFLAILIVTLRSFNRAKYLFRKQKNTVMAELVGSYRIAFLTTAVYLLIFSELFHKYLLLSIGLSQVALYFSQNDKDELKSDR